MRVRRGAWIPAFAGMTVALMGAMTNGLGYVVLRREPGCREGTRERKYS